MPGLASSRARAWPAPPSVASSTRPPGTARSRSTTSAAITGSWGKAWFIRSPSTGTIRAGGAPRRSDWEEAEEEPPSGPVEGLRMGQTRSMCTSGRATAAWPVWSGVRRGNEAGWPTRSASSAADRARADVEMRRTARSPLRGGRRADGAVAGTWAASSAATSATDGSATAGSVTGERTAGPGRPAGGGRPSARRRRRGGRGGGAWRHSAVVAHGQSGLLREHLLLPRPAVPQLDPVDGAEHQHVVLEVRRTPAAGPGSPSGPAGRSPTRARWRPTGGPGSGRCD